jgi:hypothetical protein
MARRPLVRAIDRAGVRMSSDRIRALHERQLSPEEFHTLAESPLSNDARAHT